VFLKENPEIAAKVEAQVREVLGTKAGRTVASAPSSDDEY
jgi:hypothetical protein